MAYYERNLPHWHPEGKPLFLTWRLHGSLPVSLVKYLRQTSDFQSGKAFVRFDRRLDEAKCGPAWLKHPQIARTVVDTIQFANGSSMYVLHAFVIMPNHVHMLIDPKVDLSEITRAIKGRSARICNQILGRSGQPFWQAESYDHWVRSPRSFEKIRLYIERNPVTAGLAENPEVWRWSSAYKGAPSSMGFSS
ncbi:MAG TPA: transposase [Terriglobales bacterium]|nr:transposase [Terriglobales bacterium]